MARSADILDEGKDASVSPLQQISTLIAQRRPMLTILRLVALLSQCSDKGLKQKTLDTLRTEFVRTYGFEHIETWANLESSGLIRAQTGPTAGIHRLTSSPATYAAGDTDVTSSGAMTGGGAESSGTATKGRSAMGGLFDLASTFRAMNLSSRSETAAWSTLRKQLKLIQVLPEPSSPDDMSYVTSGYAPLSVRLIQRIVSHGWSAMDIKAQLPGAERHVVRDASAPALDGVGSTAASGGASAGQVSRRTVLVCFIGGVSYTEIAALRWLSEHGAYSSQCQS